MTRVVNDGLVVRFRLFANPGEGLEDVLASRLAENAILVVSQENNILGAVAFDLSKVCEKVAGIAAGLPQLAFLIEVVDPNDHGSCGLSRCDCVE